MPSSLIFVGLVVVWLLILVPTVARRQQEVARLSPALLSGRVLERPTRHRYPEVGLMERTAPSTVGELVEARGTLPDRADRVAGRDDAFDAEIDDDGRVHGLDDGGDDRVEGDPDTGPERAGGGDGRERDPRPDTATGDATAPPRTAGEADGPGPREDGTRDLPRGDRDTAGAGADRAADLDAGDVDDVDAADRDRPVAGPGDDAGPDDVDRAADRAADGDDAVLDADGYDRDGFDEYGYDVHGFDVHGFDADGYDVDGFDAEGYDPDGYDIDGNPRPAAPRYRPGRGGFDPEAAAAAAHAKYAFRQRVVLALLVLLVAAGVTALLVSTVFWWVAGGLALCLAGYLTYLRRQVRIEESIRARRAARLTRGAHPHPAEATELAEPAPESAEETPGGADDGADAADVADVEDDEDWTADDGEPTRVRGTGEPLGVLPARRRTVDGPATTEHESSLPRLETAPPPSVPAGTSLVDVDAEEEPDTFGGPLPYRPAVGE